LQADELTDKYICLLISQYSCNILYFKFLLPNSLELLTESDIVSLLTFQFIRKVERNDEIFNIMVIVFDGSHPVV